MNPLLQVHSKEVELQQPQGTCSNSPFLRRNSTRQRCDSLQHSQTGLEKNLAAVARNRKLESSRKVLVTERSRASISISISIIIQLLKVLVGHCRELPMLNLMTLVSPKYSATLELSLILVQLTKLDFNNLNSDSKY